MAARQLIVPGAMPSRDANGRALPGLFRFYMPDTTTPATVYADAGLTVPHEFPLPSDSGGRWPQIWAEEGSFFSVGWSDQVFDATIKTFSNVQTLKDALLASADIANAAADAAIAAEAVTVAINEKFGDVDEAITAAQAAQTAAETAQGQAETAEENAEAAQVAAAASAAAAAASAAEAAEIVGFDPTNVVRVDVVQAHDDAEKAQARDNIGAQPVLGIVDRQKVATASIASGVLTLDASAASVYVVSWSANITSLVITGWAAGTDIQTLSLILVGAGGTSYAFASGTFKPLNNTAPTLSTTAGNENLLHFWTRNAGTRVGYSSSGFYPA